MISITGLFEEWLRDREEYKSQWIGGSPAAENTHEPDIVADIRGSISSGPIIFQPAEYSSGRRLLVDLASEFAPLSISGE